MKMNEIKAGDLIVADAGFTCLTAGAHAVESDSDGRLFIRCSDGLHFLDGQEGDKGHLVGLSWPHPLGDCTQSPAGPASKEDAGT